MSERNLKKIFFVAIMASLLFFGAGSALAANPVSDLIQKCGNQTTPSGDCADVSVFVTLLITVGNYVFGIVGALALLFFIYGGFTLILSQGNAEKVKKGMSIIMAAGVGLVIVFSAYILVQFLSTSLGVK
ncbi:MAG: pilin [Patescibacteria group bacterium]